MPGAEEPHWGPSLAPVPRTTSVTYHDGNSGKHDGRHQLPDPAREGRQSTRREHRDSPIAWASCTIPGHQPLPSP